MTPVSVETSVPSRGIIVYASGCALHVTFEMENVKTMAMEWFTLYLWVCGLPCTCFDRDKPAHDTLRLVSDGWRLK